VFEGLAPLVNVLMVMLLYATFLLVWTRLNLHKPLSVILNNRKGKFIPEWRIVHCNIADENTIALIHRERDRPNEACVGLPVISQHVSELVNL